MIARISRRAERDMDAIWDYIAQDSVMSADRVDESFRNAVQLLVAFPWIGHEREDVRNPAYRFWNVFNYVIVYRVRGRILIVVRVLHGHRDLSKLFRRRRPDQK